MTEGDFAALLGRSCRSAEDVTIKTAIAHMQGALSALMPDQQDSFFSDIRDAKVVEWNRSSIILKSSEGKIYRIATDEDGELAIDQGYESAFNLLSVEGALDRVFNPDAVAELQRLQAEYVTEKSGKVRNAELAELKRLKAKYEEKDND